MAFQNDTIVDDAAKRADTRDDQPGNGGADETGNETGLNGDTPAAGDVDPDSTKSAKETGQDGDPRRAGKSTGHPWNG